MKNASFGVMVMAADAAGGNEENGLGPRALWPVLGKPILGYILHAILECEPSETSIAVGVAGQEGVAIREYLQSFPDVTVFEQDSQEYREWRNRFFGAPVLSCDSPFIDSEKLRALLRGETGGESPFEGAAVSNQAGLAEANSRMRRAIVLKWMGKGVRITDPDAVWVGPDVTLEAGVSVMPGAQLWGKTFAGAGSVVGPYCIVRDSSLGRGVHLIANVIVEDSELKDNAKAGPFAYIRESSVLHENAFAGKFVEIKKTSVGSGSKVPHLSYMGDAVLGENVNIGAGSVTCNYDGAKKSQTVIGDRCFVGSDTMMVAPVTLGDDSITGAGSTITEDVPAGALAIGRARQKNIEDWALKKKQHTGRHSSCLA